MPHLNEHHLLLGGHQQQQLHWTLKPLFFEVPTAEAGAPAFVGRRWLFREAAENLSSDLPTNGGVVVSGTPGSGKTAIALQLVEHSCFGRGGQHASADQLSAVESVYNQSQLSLATNNNFGGGNDSLKELAAKVSCNLYLKKAFLLRFSIVY